MKRGNRLTEAISGILITITGASICGIAQLTGKMATKDMHPLKMCTVRYATAVPFALVATRVISGQWPQAITWSQFAMTAVIAIMAWGIGAMLFFTAMEKDSMHRVAPVSNSLSVWAVVLSIIFLKEKFFPALAVVLILLIVGIALMTPKASTERRWKWALPAALSVSLLWAVSVVLTKVLIGNINEAAFVFYTMIAAAAFHLGCSPFVKGPSSARGIQLAVISAITLVIGDTILMAGIDALPASIFSPVFATVIPFAFLGSVVVLGEKPLKRNWIGMLLIFLAAAICGFYGGQ